MILEKPRLDRARLLRDDTRWRECEQLLRRILGEIGPNERPGHPFRKGDQILIPVQKTDQIGAAE